MEWDNSATIGYNAAGESFANHDPSSSDIACLNRPESDYYNAIYLLSNESPEVPLPRKFPMHGIQTHISLHKYLPFTAEDVVISDVTLTSAVVSWTIPSFIVQEQYYVWYGTDPDNLDQVTDTITSPEDTTVINSTYSTALEGLDSGTLYYIQVVAVYDDVFARYSEVIPLITKEPGMFNTQSFLPTLAQ